MSKTVDLPAAEEAVTADIAADEVPEARWSPIQKIAMRFGALYLALWFFPMPFAAVLEIYPNAWFEQLDNVPTQIWLPLDRFFGAAIWHIDTINTKMSGSGDRLVDWLTAFSILVVALVGTIIWSWVDRKRPHYDRLYDYLRIILRYSLGFTLMGYGFAKTSQFPSPSWPELSMPLGRSTPMGLLWNFMGYSMAYSIFSGILEAGSGLLLLMRRTTTLGALLALIVMTNVFMLNMCYDVPVKLNSFHYLVVALILLLPDMKRLLDVLVFNRPTSPRSLHPEIRNRKVRTAVLAAKWVVIVAIVGSSLLSSAQAYMDAQRPRKPFEGAWVVKSFTQKGAEVPAGSLRPERMEIQLFRDRGFFMLHSGGKDSGGMLVEAGNGAFHVTTREGESNWKYTLNGNDAMTVEGSNADGPFVAQLMRNEAGMVLPRHPFHWFQERPRTP